MLHGHLDSQVPLLWQDHIRLNDSLYQGNVSEWNHIAVGLHVDIVEVRALITLRGEDHVCGLIVYDEVSFHEFGSLEEVLSS